MNNTDFTLFVVNESKAQMECSSMFKGPGFRVRYLVLSQFPPGCGTQDNLAVFACISSSVKCGYQYDQIR